MKDSEFDIITHYFARQAIHRPDVIAGIGDDGALLKIAAGKELVVSMDTLVEGVHFLSGTDPHAIGHKAMAVNLSDLAAMGAVPAWATLSLTMPEADPHWLEGFSDGLFTLARRFDVQLIGGDLTQGPLSITLQAHGLVPAGASLRRSGARAGDYIYVTGTLGDAGLGLHLTGALRVEDEPDTFITGRLLRPEPRIAEGIILRSLARAAIDISDGLLADLHHILDSSGVGAVLQVDRVPRSRAFDQILDRVFPDKPELRDDLPLVAGDDYELCFTVPSENRAAVEQQLGRLSGCTPIGMIVAEPGLHCQRKEGVDYQPSREGYEHFRAMQRRDDDG